jgi:hypothetical protein
MTRNAESICIPQTVLVEKCLIADLIQALKAVDESEVPEIHAHASRLLRSAEAASRRLGH